MYNGCLEKGCSVVALLERLPSSVGHANVQACCAIAVMLVGMANGWMGLNWGDVPAWVGSILTGSSILIASLTYRRSVRDRRVEQLDRERAQAATISTWFESEETLIVANASNAAVKVRVLFEDRFSGKPEIAYSELQIGPMSRKAMEHGWPYPYHRDMISDSPGLLIVDAAGAFWRRHSSGKVQRLDEAGRNSLERELELRFVTSREWRTYSLY